MRETIRWTRGLTAVASLALAVAALSQDAAAAQGDSTPTPGIGDGMRVGGDWSVLEGPFEKAALERQRETRYELERTNLVLDRQGGVLAREITSTVYRRVPVGEDGMVRFAWERFTARREQGPAPAEPREIPLPGTPTFMLDTGAFDLSMVAELPGPETNAADFRVLVIDALSWDLMLAELWNRSGSLAIGQEAQIERPPEEPQTVPGGTYEVGLGRMRVAGITRVGGEACLEVSFAIDGSHVSISTAGIAFRGHEYVRGTFAISLLDGRLVAGRLWGPLIATFRQGAGPDAPELPLGGIVQYVTLRELGASSGEGG